MRNSMLALGAVLLAAVMAAGCGTTGTTSEKARDLAEAAPTATQTAPLQPGRRVPDVTVKSMEGQPLRLRQMVRGKPTVLVFYRGGWCPYCTQHLAELAKAEPALVEMGYQVLAISADRPAGARETQDNYGYHYKLLSDHEMKAARAFGIAFRVDDATVQRYHGFGIDLEEASGRSHHLLPVPSVFIVGADGTIRYTYSNPDYKVRLDREEMLSAAREAI